ncbi:MAG TPA: hypothetical protein VGS22_13550 [Thermoanaerobaculia bacterium]|jgi:photosystem II stability/assembly factor-like uncharacterized protein|nr:hypothetical protein [Thermoanaerobaculia bacterium]
MPDRRSFPLSLPLSGVVGALLLFSLAAAATSKPAGKAHPRPMPPPIRKALQDRDLRSQDNPGEAMKFYLAKRLPKDESSLPIERYVTARVQMERMPQVDLGRVKRLPPEQQRDAAESEAAAPEETPIDLEGDRSVASWSPLGPADIGGRTRALVIDPRTPRIFYAGGVDGGVWKSTNAGTRWAAVGDLMTNLAVTSLVMDPTSSSTLYAGTGEGFFNADAIRGLGIFKTTNGGTTWTSLAATRNASFSYVNDLVISSKNRDRLYAATRTGIWRTTNGGSTWTRIFNPGVAEGCFDLAIRTDKINDVVFAACGSTTRGSVSRNVKAESTEVWVPVLAEAGMGRTSLALAPSNQNIIYALAESLAPGDYQLGLHAVFRSTAGGDPDSWTAQVRNTDATKLNTLLLSNPVLASLSECGLGGTNAFVNQGGYANVIAVDPRDPNRVFVGGIDLFRSDDAGKNWGIVSYGWAEGPPDAPSFAPSGHHAIVFHPQYNGTTNQVLFVGGDGGIVRTENARAKSGKGLEVCDPHRANVVWRRLNDGYEVTRFYHGAVFPDGEAYFGGSQGNGTLVGDTASGRNGWEKLLAGDGGYVAVDPTNPQTLYAENFGLSIQKSTDGGTTFNDVTGDIDDNGFLYIAPFGLDPSEPRRLWTGGAFIWRTDDGAATWTRASTGVAGDDDSLVSAVGIAPSNAHRVLVGLSDGFIHRNDSALNAEGVVWPVVLPRDGFVSSIAFDPADDRVAYATYSTFGGDHVWRTTDGGAHWAPAGGSGATGIPDIPVLSIVVDPGAPTVLYAGTDLGVFVSNNSGATWAVAGLPGVSTEHLEIHVAPGGEETLFAFTHGRGAWKVRINP